MQIDYTNKAIELLHSVETQNQEGDLQQLSVQLATYIVEASKEGQSVDELSFGPIIPYLQKNLDAKVFCLNFIDQIFRSCTYQALVKQIIYLFDKHGLPEFLGKWTCFKAKIFQRLPQSISQIFVPAIRDFVISKCFDLVVNADPEELTDRLLDMEKMSVAVVIHRLQNRVFSNQDIAQNMKDYLGDLKNPLIASIQVGIGQICNAANSRKFSQAQGCALENLRTLYRASVKNQIVHADGHKRPKKVILSFSSYEEMLLCQEVFLQIIQEKEFSQYPAAISLASFIPESYEILQSISSIAKARKRAGGAALNIHIYKGGNFQNEKIKASIDNQILPVFNLKEETDAHFIKIMQFALDRENIMSLKVTVESHNLFDLCFCLLQAAKNHSLSYLSFSFYQGMFSPFLKVFKNIHANIYSLFPVVEYEDFDPAVSYLFQTIDEMTSKSSFYRFICNGQIGSSDWILQSKQFFESFNYIDKLSHLNKKSIHQNTNSTFLDDAFCNSRLIDFSMSQNREKISHQLQLWSKQKHDKIPLQIAGALIFEEDFSSKVLFPKAEKNQYHFCVANKSHLQTALDTASESVEKLYSISFPDRSKVLQNIANKILAFKEEFIGLICQEVGKLAHQADAEVALACDVANVYAKSALEFSKLTSVQFSPKGTVGIITSWEMPFAEAVNAILAAFVTGNSIIFKPHSEAVLVGYKLCQLFWNEGISMQTLQFLPSNKEEVLHELMKSWQIDFLFFSGEPCFAHKIYKTRPDIDLIGDVHGKNCIIVSSLCDPDKAIEAIVNSSVTFSGQSNTSASLAIIDSELYDNANFMQRLKNAFLALKVGSAFDLNIDVGPLMHSPKHVIKRSLSKLDYGEKWLLPPMQKSDDTTLWSPGVKLDVRPYGFSHMQERLGPVISLMRSDDLRHSLEMANLIPHKACLIFIGLNEVEHKKIIEKSLFTNIFINRSLTHFVARRQIFGLNQLNAISPGLKMGGGNFLIQFMKAKETSLPQRKGPIQEKVGSLTALLDEMDIGSDKLALWAASISNYSFAWQKMQKHTDTSKVLGQDNFIKLMPLKKMCLRIDKNSDFFDAIRICAASMTVGAELEISLDESLDMISFYLIPSIVLIRESLSELIRRIEKGRISKIRMAGSAPYELIKHAHENFVPVVTDAVVSTGRIELLHYIAEVSLSYDYHRYGNLGARETEIRSGL